MLAATYLLLAFPLLRKKHSLSDFKKKKKKKKLKHVLSYTVDSISYVRNFEQLSTQARLR